MNYFNELSVVLQSIDQELLNLLLKEVYNTVKRNGTIFLCGNGGSYSNSQHWATDIQKLTNSKTIVLGSNISLLTAQSNDVGYETIFSRDLDVISNTRDLLICLSCSGKSENIKLAIHSADKIGMQSILVTSVISPTYNNVLQIYINSKIYGIIEDCHSAIGHWLSYALMDMLEEDKRWQ